jgi:hypothetical protein
MSMKSTILALAATALVAGAAPSFAQGIQIGPDGVRIVQPGENMRDRDAPQRGMGREIGERDAVSIARSEGMREIDTVSRRSNSYRVVGVDRRGDDLQVDIDRRTGEVISVR